jgi:NADPH:quinone reductase-like Zn-dependent oxidoreductase
MQVYRLTGEPGAERVRLYQCGTPDPGPGQALVRLRAASLNYRDLLIAGGMSAGGRTDEGRIPLSDGAGEVEAVGEGVVRVKPGDRVAAIFRQDWLAGPFPGGTGQDLGGPVDGMLAEYVVLPAEGLVKFPAELSFEEAACLPCAAVTAWNAVVTAGSLKPGEIVLTLGTGGVSLFALQFAKLAGARVISTTSSPAKTERLLAAGAEAVIDTKQTPDWEKEVMRLTGGAGADLVVETGGAGTLPKSLASGALHGRINLVGVMAQGDAPLGSAFWHIFLRELHLTSVHVGSRADFEAMNLAVAANGLRPFIDRIFPFAQVPAAYDYLQAGRHFGKVVICF